MKARELRELATEEVEQKRRELWREYFEQRKTQVAGKLDNPLKIRQLRRDLARIATVLRARAAK